MHLATKTQSFSQLIIDVYRSLKPLILRLLPAYFFTLLILYTIGNVFSGGVNGNITSFSFTESFLWIIGLAYETLTTLTLSQPDLPYLKIGIIFDFVTLSIICFCFIFFSAYFFVVMLNTADTTIAVKPASNPWIMGIKRYLITFGYCIIFSAILLAIIFYTITFGFDFAKTGIWAVGLLYLITLIAISTLCIRLCYTLPLIASRRHSIGNAMKQSWILTRGYFWQLTGALIATVIIPATLFVLFFSLCQMILPEGNIANIVLPIISGIKGLIIMTLVIAALYVFMNDSEIKHGVKNVSSD